MKKETGEGCDDEDTITSWKTLEKEDTQNIPSSLGEHSKSLRRSDIADMVPDTDSSICKKAEKKSH